jgi:hypothetical protein
MGLKNGLAHGGISKTVSVNVINTHSGALHRSESEERINGSGMPKAYDGSGISQHAWVPGTMELGELSPRSQKTEGSVTSGSVHSKESRV